MLYIKNGRILTMAGTIWENGQVLIEKGKINSPSLTLCTLADYFEVSTDYLLGRSDER